MTLRIPDRSQVVFEVDTSPAVVDVVGDLFLGVRQLGGTDWTTHLIRGTRRDPSIPLPTNTSWEARGIMVGPGFKHLVNGQFFVASEGRQSVTLRGAPVQDCRGNVFDRDGAPAAGFWVRALDAVQADLPEEVVWTCVQPDGAFLAVDPLGTGEVEVWDPRRTAMVASGRGPRLVVDTAAQARDR